MSFPIQPLSTYVVVRAEEKKTATASGILLTESAQDKPDTRVVEAVAKDVKSVKQGDKVLCSSYAGTKVTVDKTEYTLVKEEDILAIINQ